MPSSPFNFLQVCFLFHLFGIDWAANRYCFRLAYHSQYNSTKYRNHGTVSLSSYRTGHGMVLWLWNPEVWTSSGFTSPWSWRRCGHTPNQQDSLCSWPLFSLSCKCQLWAQGNPVLHTLDEENSIEIRHISGGKLAMMYEMWGCSHIAYRMYRRTHLWPEKISYVPCRWAGVGFHSMTIL